MSTKMIVMMRPVMIFMVATLSTVMFAGEGEVTVQYRSIDLWWDSHTNRWINDSKTEYLYDMQGNLIEKIYSYWNEDAGEWYYPEGGYYFFWYFEPGRETYSYDTHGNLIHYAYYYWDQATGQWIEQYREENSYCEENLTDHESYYRDMESMQWWGSDKYKAEFNADGNLIRETNFYWDETRYGWTPGWESIFSYNPEGQRTETVSSTWEPYLDAWRPDNRNIFLYDSAGQRTCTVNYWWNGFSWQGQDSTVTSYVAPDLPAEECNYFWDDQTDFWIPNYREQNTYDVNGFLSERVETFWDLFLKQWQGSYRMVENYNAEGLLLESASYHWDEEWNDWRGSSREVNTYNSQGLRENSSDFRWENDSWSWTETNRRTYFYDPMLHLTEENSMYWDRYSGRWWWDNKYTYTYDHYGNQNSRMVSIYDDRVAEWVPSSKNISEWAPLGSRPVYILDQALLEALIGAGVDSNEDSIITYTEAETVIALDLAGQAISDLTGLEAFVNLDSLDLHNNPIQKIDLPLVPGLTFLDCSNCELNELDVDGLPGLETLICSRNGLVKLDLTGTPEIKVLDLSYMPYLKEVCVPETPFPPGGEVLVENSPNIIITSDCSISFPSENLLIALLEQGVDANGDSLISVSEALAVRELDLSGYWISNFSGLEEFTGLEKLEIRNNPNGLPDLTDFPLLTYLDCSGTEMYSLDLAGVPLLTTLICRGCEMGTLNISQNGMLSYLDCADNYLYELSVFRNDELKYLDVSNMPGLELCVFQLPFPPEGVECISENSDGIHFESECSVFQDRFEDNDYLWQAVPINENMVYKDLAVSEYDGDWYELVPQGGILVNTLTLQCSFTHTMGDINMEVLSVEGNLLAESRSNSDDETITIPMSPLKKYYVHVELDSGQYNEYSLSWITNIYNPQSSLSICDQHDHCTLCDILPEFRDTTYALDTLYFELFAGDTASQSVTMENLGPEPYIFYTSMNCTPTQDDKNYAIRFDGVDDHIEIRRSPYIDLDHAITLEAWVKFEGDIDGISPIISRILNGYGYELYSQWMNGERRIGFRMDNGLVLSQQHLESQRWYHLAVSYDSERIRLYINGIKDAETPVSGNISVVTQQIVIGSNSPMDMKPLFFCGEIDEVRIWNESRSALEIQTNYQRQLSGREEGLVGYWPLNNLYESVVVDQTGNSKGYISGGALRVHSTAPVERIISTCPLSEVIPNDSSKTLFLGVQALDRTGGTYQLDIEFYSNRQEKPDIILPVRVQVLDAPSISVNLKELQFGDVDIYETNSIELVVTNHGNQELILDSLSTSVDGTRIVPGTCSVPPGESRTIRLEAFFRMEGLYQGNMVLYSNDPTNGVVTLPIDAIAFNIAPPYVLLGTIDDTIQSGKQLIYNVSFFNSKSISGLTMTHSIEYLALPDLANNRFYQTTTGNWMVTNIQSPYVVLPPGGMYYFSVVLDATSLVEGDYYAVLEMEWYNPAKGNGYLPVRLHVTGPGVGLEQFSEQVNDVTLFPNPTDGWVTIKTNETIIHHILVTSITGQVIRSIEVSGPEIHLDLSSLEKGPYMVTVRMKEKVVTLPVIKF